MSSESKQSQASPIVITEHDTYLFKEGSHFRLYNRLGAHTLTHNGIEGTYFAVWAPNAEYVSVIGNFNGWNKGSHPLGVRWDSSGIWEGFVPHVKSGELYKYWIVSKGQKYSAEKIDPFAFYSEIPPKTASIVCKLDYTWSDSSWMKSRGAKGGLNSPISVYEVHLGSWMRKVEEGNRSLSYRELAQTLTEYVKKMGYTHVEFMPIMEHPFYGSWGYQTLGYFAPSNRYGPPQDFMYLIDQLHQNNIGVILDWVPGHFPSDEHGLAYFDGTNLYEHDNPLKKVHPDWATYVFNHGRNEVSEFLISSALFWLDKYHIDGLRVDAVASMIYLDYSRKEGEWIPNQQGGRENIESIHFIKRLNEVVYQAYPDVQMIAEESTSWPMVSRPTSMGGLGFGFKWNMGWMHDTLVYFDKDPIYRKYHQNDLTFSMLYAFHENFVLSISHDEVVHGKRSLLSKMPGDAWQKFANLRLLFGYMFSHPGKKLMFMGSEFGQWDEWDHESSVQWHLVQYDRHSQLQHWVQDLNKIYKNEKALHELDNEPGGFEWVDCSDYEKSTLSFIRKDREGKAILVVCNFTPSVHAPYRIGVPHAGFWKEILNSDANVYGGSGIGNLGGVNSRPAPFHGRPHSIEITLPPLSVVLFKLNKS